MPARTPEEVHQLFGACFNAHDLDGMVALYEPGATLVPQPGVPVTGTEVLRATLGQFVATKPVFRLTPLRAVRSGDLALLIASWTLSGTGPDGAAVYLEGTATDVVRLQADGTWRYAIDNPYGVA